MTLKLPLTLPPRKPPRRGFHGFGLEKIWQKCLKKALLSKMWLSALFWRICKAGFA
jgi:hypothetical protein